MTLSTTTEYYLNGESKDLSKARQAKYRKRVKLAMALLHSAESRGLSGFEAIAALQHIDYRALQECVSQGITAAPDNFGLETIAADE